MLIAKSKKYYVSKKLKGFGVDKTFKERKTPGVYDVKHLGLNFRLSETQAAMGIAQMKKLRKILKLRERNFRLLQNKLNNVENLKVLRTGSNSKFKSAYYALNIILSKNLIKKENI